MAESPHDRAARRVHLRCAMPIRRARLAIFLIALLTFFCDRSEAASNDASLPRAPARSRSRPIHDAGEVTTAIGVIGLVGSTIGIGYTFVNAAATCNTDRDYANGGYYPTPDCPSFVPAMLAFSASVIVTTVGIALLVGDRPSRPHSSGRQAATVFLRAPTTEGSVTPRSGARPLPRPSIAPGAWTASILSISF